jgi:hypothetical protein
MSSVILTSYFSKKTHPNHPNDNHVVGREKDGRVTQNSFAYIKPWYESVKSLSLKGIIFHDGLTNDFVEKYSTDEIKFIHVDSQSQSHSNLDYRWFCYRDFLSKNKFESVFISDCSDVSVVKDPSEILKKYSNYDFFLCKDSIPFNKFPYFDIHKKYNWPCFLDLLLKKNSLDLINMGVVGGSYENIIDFLDKYYETRLSMEDKSFHQADMWVGNYIFRILLKNKNLLIGKPFTSEFKKYQNDRKDVYFIHK